MKIKTAKAVLKINSEDKRYWNLWLEESKDTIDMEPGQPISIHPNGFDIGTEINVFEDVGLDEKEEISLAQSACPTAKLKRKVKSVDPNELDEEIIDKIIKEA